ncbi:MAG: NAD(P)H-hydrate dehydratase [Anaerolineae bacterium]|jgi:NAD(P)H-hydrate epimerase|nr:NAD(P)H-hydrate dehydratase [Anaerolineae bacterium]
MRLLSVAEMRALEADADAAGHGYARMMAQAGAAVAQAIEEREPIAERAIVVLVGPGNNGGDGLVVARLLRERGAKVQAYLSAVRDEATDEVYRQAIAAGVEILVDNQDALRRAVLQADVLVDALLGTGAKPPLRGAIAAILENVRIALAPAPPTLAPVHAVAPAWRPRPRIVAVDGPSGLDFDTGEADPLALDASLTITFAAPKWGHVRLPGAAKVGELLVADIGIPESVIVPAGPALATPDVVAGWLPPRPAGANKGTFGRAMIVAGSSNYTGAAILSASAAVRAGAGLVTLALPGILHTAVVAAIPEATYLLLPHTLGVVNERAVPVLRDGVEGYTALLVGPGLGNTVESRAFLRTLLRSGGAIRPTGFVKSDVPASAPLDLPALVIDADGLNILSTAAAWPELLPPDTILTPHPGEMARLTGLSIDEIQSARIETAQTWANAWQQIVVLKGAFTVVAAPGEQPMLLPFANAGLAKAGTGDVLAGAIVALRAQGLSAFRAAIAGAYLHGLAGEIVTQRVGAAGTAASDVAHALAEAWRRLQNR